MKMHRKWCQKSQYECLQFLCRTGPPDNLTTESIGFQPNTFLVLNLTIPKKESYYKNLHKHLKISEDL